MKRLTNKLIIKELLPQLNKGFQDWKEGGMNTEDLEYSRFLAVTKLLQGRYDNATLSATIVDGKIISISYSKEYTGMGNGYYASVDNNGNIIKGEWD